MKTQLMLLAALAVSTAGASELTRTPQGVTVKWDCAPTNLNTVPYTEFQIVAQAGKATVKYRVWPFYGAELAAPSYRVYDSCKDVPWTEEKRDRKFYMECAGDGDGGYATFYVNKNRRTRLTRIKGTFNFPNSGPDDSNIDSEAVELACRPTR